jgi:hypothetical protein
MAQTDRSKSEIAIRKKFEKIHEFEFILVVLNDDEEIRGNCKFSDADDGILLALEDGSQSRLIHYAEIKRIKTGFAALPLKKQIYNIEHFWGYLCI